MPMASLKIGLVLGGGGARGLAHIGVLKVLEKNNIPVHVITGTSMGALIGALYAQHPDAEWVEKRVHQFLDSDVFRRSGGNVFRQHRADYEPEDVLRQLSHRIKKRIVINLAAHRISLMKGERLQLAIDELIDDGKIEDTKIPFACASTDLQRRYSGLHPARRAKRASAHRWQRVQQFSGGGGPQAGREFHYCQRCYAGR